MARNCNWSRNCQSYCGPIDCYMRDSSLRRPLCGLLLAPCIWPSLLPLVEIRIW